jgi:aryl-alcohol dehydrogenase-like predicted oxidoreductase
MENVSLGKTDMQVSPIGLGCWQFSRTKRLPGSFWGILDAAQIREIVSVSLEEGINWFDTAEAYGWGNSEKSTADALKACGIEPGEIIVATKWFPFLRWAGSIKKTIDKRLKHLASFPIDLHQIHFPASFSSIKKQMNAMADLQAEGKIRSIGVSNFSASRMRRAQAALEARGMALVSNQVRYSLLDRGIERNGSLDTAKELGVTIIAYSPLAQGILSGKYHADPDLIKQRVGPRKHMSRFKRKGLEKSAPLVKELKRIASSHDATPSQVALNWLIRFHGSVVVVIPGAYTTEQARENAGAMKLELSQEELKRLHEISKDL